MGTCTAECASESGSCMPCKGVMAEKIDYAFNSAGGVGLFFAFTELAAILYAHRFRTHLKEQCNHFSCSPPHKCYDNWSSVGLPFQKFTRSRKSSSYCKPSLRSPIFVISKIEQQNLCGCVIIL